MNFIAVPVPITMRLTFATPANLYMHPIMVAQSECSEQRLSGPKLNERTYTSRLPSPANLESLSETAETSVENRPPN